MRIHALFAFYGVLAAVTGKTVEMMKVHHEIKKWLSLFITLAMLFGLSGLISANAAETNSQFAIPEGVIPATPEEFEAYWNSLSEEEKAFIAEKEAASAQLAEQVENQPATRAASKISIPGSFTIYKQEKCNYCVPACLKSVIQYLNGSSPSQSSIASALYLKPEDKGVKAYRIKPYLDSKVDYTYVWTMDPSTTQIRDHLYYAVVSQDVPGLMTVCDMGEGVWKYQTEGHCVVVNAVYSDKSRIQVADPLGGSNGRPTFFEIKTDVLESICMDIFW